MADGGIADGIEVERMPEKSMRELQALVGETRKTVEGFHIEAGKVDEFARAIGDESLVSRPGEHEQGEAPAPPTFPCVSRFARYRPDGLVGYLGFDLGFERAHTVVGEKEFEFERPIYVGDTLSGTTTLTSVYRREGDRGGTMTFAEFETEYRDAEDTVVATERHVRIETGAAREEGGADG